MLQRAASTAQLPRAMGSPHPWGGSVTMGMWHLGTSSVGMVGWAGVGLVILEVFSNLNMSIALLFYACCWRRSAGVQQQELAGLFAAPLSAQEPPAVLEVGSRCGSACSSHLCFSAECPLTAAAQLELSTEMIKALRNGGAHLDFRTREGMTALHKAVRCRNHAALLVSPHPTVASPHSSAGESTSQCW